MITLSIRARKFLRRTKRRYFFLTRFVSSRNLYSGSLILPFSTNVYFLCEHFHMFVWSQPLFDKNTLSLIFFLKVIGKIFNFFILFIVLDHKRMFRKFPLLHFCQRFEIIYYVKNFLANTLLRLLRKLAFHVIKIKIRFCLKMFPKWLSNFLWLIFF